MFRAFALSLCVLVAVACGVPSDPIDPGPKPIVKPPEPEKRALQSVPALTGGTLLVTKSGLAVAADPERDLVWVVDLSKREVKGWLTVNVGDEPGRLIEDGHGLVHVALRRGGALVTFDPAAEKLEATSRRDVCAEPRGLALDTQTASVVVACTGGELVWLPEAGGAATTRLQADQDLRDVVINGDTLTVTTFRTAQVITMNRAGNVMTRTALPRGSNRLGTLAPSVAWRTVTLPGGKLGVVHHRAKTESIQLSMSSTTMTPPNGTPSQSPYGSNDGFNCPESIVDSAITVIGSTPADTRQGQLATGSLPVDIAVDSSGYQIGVVTASPGKVSILYAANLLEQQSFGQCTKVEREVVTEGEPIAVAWQGGSTLYAQTRNPAGLRGSDGSVINFPVEARVDKGFSMFHQQAGAPLACASCHPEGRDDARVWNFIPGGARRTQSLNGGILRTAPFHWDGALADVGALMNDVFVKRMGGRTPTSEDVTAISTWVDSLPASKPHFAEASAVERGKAIFEAPATKCASCHLGARFTNNDSVDVGTGEKLQVPGLIGVGYRGPWMHNGCAITLKDRFTNTVCGGGDQHGVTSHLTPTEVDDLVAYLQAL